MLRSLRCAALLGSLFLSASALAVDIDPASYGYPLTNPFEATIATTPPNLRPQLPSDDEINQSDYSLTMRPERQFSLPDNFWAVKKLTYRIAKQDHAAPLIFLISGTGARYDSSINEYLKSSITKPATTWSSCPRPPASTSSPRLRASPLPALPRKTPKTCTA